MNAPPTNTDQLISLEALQSRVQRWQGGPLELLALLDLLAQPEGQTRQEACAKLKHDSLGWLNNAHRWQQRGWVTRSYDYSANPNGRPRVRFTATAKAFEHLGIEPPSWIERPFVIRAHHASRGTVFFRRMASTPQAAVRQCNLRSMMLEEVRPAAPAEMES